MISYPNNNVQSIGDQTVGRVLRLDNPEAITPRKLFSYINEGFVPFVMLETNGTTSYTMVTFTGYPSVDLDSYTLTVMGGSTYTATGFDSEYALPSASGPSEGV